jgi:hypothetical protein
MAEEIVHANTASPSFVGNEDVSYKLQCLSCSRMKSDFEILVNKIKSMTEIISILNELKRSVKCIVYMNYAYSCVHSLSAWCSELFSCLSA